MTKGYLIYHPRRDTTIIGHQTIHHDRFGNNEDPYLWNEQFLHSFCHITQLPNEEGQINFWISGNRYPKFTELHCDCVFVIQEKLYWENANWIEISNKIVDGQDSFDHHYKWVNPPYKHHWFKKRRRYTLKANPRKSFQPQDARGNLVDILPILNQLGYPTKNLVAAITSKRGSRPFELSADAVTAIYQYLARSAVTKIKGLDLVGRHPNSNTKNIQTAKKC